MQIGRIAPLVVSCIELVATGLLAVASALGSATAHSATTMRNPQAGGRAAEGDRGGPAETGE